MWKEMQVPNPSHHVVPLLSAMQEIMQCHASQLCVPLQALLRLMPHPCATPYTSLHSLLELSISLGSVISHLTLEVHLLYYHLSQLLDRHFILLIN
ncbi:hypothetical protein E2C01_011563 [Portunus trituberculatus]|uniref:Uncharacterized protein n=1 Tax=Portunus trituberculatus TaxID=210409 RepID=A0A5B7DBI1_PORTR|nr:hypothetical protein [Portunus trituberculatus]